MLAQSLTRGSLMQTTAGLMTSVVTFLRQILLGNRKWSAIISQWSMISTILSFTSRFSKEICVAG
jgi:hypothetical protein